MSKLRQLYKKQKQDLQKRQEESIADKGGLFSSYFQMSSAPEGTKFWKCSEGQHIIDVIPFFAGPNMPKVGASTCREGQLAWLIDLWIHRNVGILEDSIICPARTNKEPCPICEHLKQYKDQYTEEEFKAMIAKRRVMYLIWDHTSATEKEKGVQVWEVAHWFMEDKIREIMPVTGGTIQYFDPDGGKHIVFVKRGSKENVSFFNHRFEDRANPVPDSILDQSFPLDSLLVYTSYKDMKKAFLEGLAHSDSKNTSVGATGVSNDEGMVETDAPFDVEGESGFVEVDQDQGEDQLVSGECPYGGTFGVDTDTLTECKTCQQWDDCAAEALQNQQGGQEQEPEPPPPPPQRQPLRRPEPQQKQTKQQASPPAGGRTLRRTSLR